jgi:hypothetical protein
MEMTASVAVDRVDGPNARDILAARIANIARRMEANDNSGQ